MAGICAKAFAKPLNNYNYQGDYSEEEGETGWNDFDLRSYDPQIARWMQADPYDEFASPYVGMRGDPVNNVDPDGGSIFEGVGLGMRTFVGALAGAIAGVAAAHLTNNEDDAGEWAGYGALIGGGLTYILSSPLYVNVQFVPNWKQVGWDIKKSNGKLTSPYFDVKIKSIFNEILSLGKIVTITGDGFVSGERYRDENNQIQVSKGTLTSNLVAYFKRHPLAIGVVNAFSEFHSRYMGFAKNSGADQFKGISSYFNCNSTFLYGNCSQQSETDETSKVLNGATVIGSYTQQLDLPFALAGVHSGNPELGKQGIVVSPTNKNLSNNFMMHRISQNGKTVINGRVQTKIRSNGKISFKKLSEVEARRLNDRYYKLGGNVFKNIISILKNGN